MKGRRKVVRGVTGSRARAAAWSGVLFACACASTGREEPPEGEGGGLGGLDGSAGAFPESPSCVEALWQPEPVPLDLLFLVNRSFGMEGPAWRPHLTLIRDSLLQFSDTARAPGLALGLQVFPSLEGERCLPSSYRAPLVPFEVTPDVTDELKLALDEAAKPVNRGQIGSTPLRPALRGSYDFLRAHLEEHPGQQAAVVIVTNGASYDCGSPWDLEDIEHAVARARQEEPSIATFIVGLEGSSVLEGNNSLAAAGGTEKVIFVGERVGTVDLALSLETIRRRASSCAFDLPRPPWARIDPWSVRLRSSAGDEASTTLPLLESEADCAGGREGFYYADPAAPRRVVLCPVSCAIARADEDAADFELEVGCVEVVR